MVCQLIRQINRQIDIFIFIKEYRWIDMYEYEMVCQLIVNINNEKHCAVKKYIDRQIDRDIYRQINRQIDIYVFRQEYRLISMNMKWQPINCEHEQ